MGTDGEPSIYPTSDLRLLNVSISLTNNKMVWSYSQKLRSSDFYLFGRLVSVYGPRSFVPT